MEWVEVEIGKYESMTTGISKAQNQVLRQHQTPRRVQEALRGVPCSLAQVTNPHAPCYVHSNRGYSQQLDYSSFPDPSRNHEAVCNAWLHDSPGSGRKIQLGSHRSSECSMSRLIGSFSLDRLWNPSGSGS